jgi:hypothetical protein
MKAVLMSIKPRWCELIASGKKTVEVRKTKPQIAPPFKVYIYETKDKRYENIGVCGWKEDGTKYIFNNHCGRVIGEFVCYRIDEFTKAFFDEQEPNDTDLICFFLDQFCLSYSELCAYVGLKDFYGWNITDLVIYDKPMGLGEFKPYNRTEDDCKFSHLGFAIPKCQECRECYVKRPPQSWCYVEEVTE